MALADWMVGLDPEAAWMVPQMAPLDLALAAPQEELEVPRAEQIRRRYLDPSKVGASVRAAGDLVIPQDFGDALLGLAMTPGLGRAARTGFAALGGATADPSEAEASFIDTRGLGRLFRQRGELTPGDRRFVEQRRDSLDEATRMLNAERPAAERLRNPQQYPGTEVNQAFDDIAPALYASTGWFRTPETWLTALDPKRHVWPTGNIMAGFRVNEPPGHLVDDLADDMLFRAEPGLQNTRILHFERQPNQPLGAFVRGEKGFPDTVAVGHQFDGDVAARMNLDNETLYHEIQHNIQRLQGRGNGSNAARVAKDNPGLWNEYLDFAQTSGLYRPEDVDLAARLRMYRKVPGEWEAEAAAKIMGARDDLSGLSTLDPESIFYMAPDFRLRGIR